MREIKEMIIPLKEGKLNPYSPRYKLGVHSVVEEARMWDEEPEVEGDTIECKFYFKGSDKESFVSYLTEFIGKIKQYDPNAVKDCYDVNFYTQDKDGNLHALEARVQE